MKKLSQLLIIEADEEMTPLQATHGDLLQAYSASPVATQSLPEVARASIQSAPILVLLHINLRSINDYKTFVQVFTSLPYSTIIIVSEVQDEELCFMTLEAGADDAINAKNLTNNYLRKAVLLSQRRNQVEKELSQNKTQLLACIQNTPNVAVQWYNSGGEVLFWNHASETMFGWTASEAVGRKLDELLYTPEEFQDFLNGMKQVAATGKPAQPREFSFRKRNGEEGHCISTLFAIPSFSKEPWFVCMDVDISDRKSVELLLQKSEENYHTLFNQASDAIFINDDEGNFIDVNQQACQLLKCSREKLLQLKVQDLYSAEALEAKPLMRQELLEGQRTAIERCMLTTDGTEVPVEITAQRFTNGRTMAIVRDISDRKEAEKELRQSEEKYRSLVEQQADAITIFDDNARILDVNSSATQMLDYTREEFRHMTLLDVLSNEDKADNPIDFGGLEVGKATIKQRKMRRKDGNLIDTEVHTKRLSNGLYLSSVRDLRERIAVQQQLEKEIKLSDSIINSLPGLFYLFTKDGTYLRWNKQLEVISGYSSDEIRNLSPSQFFSAEDQPLVQLEIENVFKKGQSSIESNLLTKDGRKIPFYFTGIEVEYAGTKCLLGTGIDLTPMKTLEKELSQQKIAEQKKIMQAMIEAGEKEKNKLGLELHDNVNQILSVVRMYLTILSSEKEMEGVTLAQTINLLNTAMEEIRHLSHSLAVSYKFEIGLEEALKDMVEKIKLTKDFSIQLTTPPTLNEVTNSTQKLAIFRIVQEQFNNIIKHAKATCLQVIIEIKDGAIVLQINDDGKGFLLSPGGKGLGINNIINRAEALEGKAVFDTAPGEGCRLTVTIPLQSEAATAAL